MSSEQQWNGFNDFCHVYKLPENVLGALVTPWAFGLTAFAILRLYFPPHSWLHSVEQLKQTAFSWVLT